MSSKISNLLKAGFFFLLIVGILIYKFSGAMKEGQNWVWPAVAVSAVLVVAFIKRAFEKQRLKSQTAGGYRHYDFSQKLVKHFYQDTNLQLASICRFTTMLSQLSHMQSHETGDHIKRVSEYTRILCAASGMDDEAAKVSMASMMHDIGKLDVPLSILEKPGKLTPDEFEIIKTHVTAGHKLLAGSPGELMQISAKIALEHHERWDGT